MFACIPSWANKPFIWAVLTAISLAYVSPNIGSKDGFLKPEITIKYGAVIIIFLISGLSLKTEELGSAILQYRLHFFVQSFSLLFMPVLTQIVISIGKFHFPHDLMTGFVVVSCMPPPVSSAIILTKEVGGNEAAAVFNSALGSLLGIFVTPVLLFFMLGSSSSVPVLEAFFQLSFTIIFPVMVGQFLRYFYENIITQVKKELSTTSSTMLLLIIYCTFCETFSQDTPHLNFLLVIFTIVMAVIFQCFFMTAVFYFTTSFGVYFLPEDTIASMFCATHKSLTLGFPLLKLLYEGNSTFIIISFPLLVYHPTQILLGSLLVPFLQTWLQKNNKRRKYRLHPV